MSSLIQKMKLPILERLESTKKEFKNAELVNTMMMPADKRTPAQEN